MDPPHTSLCGQLINTYPVTRMTINWKALLSVTQKTMIYGFKGNCFNFADRRLCLTESKGLAEIHSKKSYRFTVTII